MGQPLNPGNVLYSDASGIPVIVDATHPLPVTTGTTTIATGDVASGATDSGNPVKIGALAIAGLSTATLVTTGQRVNVSADLDGALINHPHCALEDIVSGRATNTDGTATALIGAQSAGIKTYLTTIILANTSASNITVDIKDGSTIKLSFPVPAGAGAVCNPPVPLPGSAATAWNFQGSAAATTLTVSAIGFKSKV